MNLRNRKGEAATDGNLELKQRTNWRPLLFELFIVFSLFAAYFFMVRNYFSYGNPMSGNVFMAGSEKLYRLDQPFMGQHWNGRLPGLLLSGALMDFSLNETGAHDAQIDRLANVFGLYHAVWLLMLFVCVTLALRHSLFINLGIFAGLMYNFSPTSGPYFYPWDMPAMLFFTLAVLFFERRRLWMMVLAICAGAFFKETVLVCALLILFAGEWNWKKRIATFVGIGVAYAIGKKLMLSQLEVEAPMFSMSGAFSSGGSLLPVTLFHNVMGNLKDLLAPTFNSIIFVNAGTLIAVLVLGWRKRFLPYMTVIVTFVLGLFVIAQTPGVSEVRDFMEVLPLSLILLSLLWTEFSGANQSAESATGRGTLWPVRETFPLLLPVVIALVVLTTSIAVLQYYIIYEDIKPANRTQSQLGAYIYKNGKPESIAAVSEWFRNGYLDAELKLAMILQRDQDNSNAAVQYQRVLDVDTNSVYALNNLATILATDSVPRLRDGQRAVTLAERACQLSQDHEPVLLYTLAAAYAEAGRFNDAVTTGEQARALAQSQGQEDIVKQNEALLELYKSGHAFHQQPAPTTP